MCTCLHREFSSHVRYISLVFRERKNISRYEFGLHANKKVLFFNCLKQSKAIIHVPVFIHIVCSYFYLFGVETGARQIEAQFCFWLPDGTTSHMPTE